MYYQYLETLMDNLDFDALAEAEVMLSKQSWYGHHLEKNQVVYSCETLLVSMAEFDEWAKAVTDRIVTLETEWDAELVFAGKNGMATDPNFGTFGEFELGVVDGFLSVMRTALRDAGLEPTGEKEYQHEYQSIVPVKSFADLLASEPLNADDQHACGVLAGKLMALNRFGLDEWELDDIKLTHSI